MNTGGSVHLNLLFLLGSYLVFEKNRKGTSFSAYRALYTSGPNWECFLSSPCVNSSALSDTMRVRFNCQILIALSSLLCGGQALIPASLSRSIPKRSLSRGLGAGGLKMWLGTGKHEKVRGVNLSFS